MIQNGVSSLGYGLPMRASFALAIFYSDADTTVAPFSTAPFTAVCHVQTYTETAEV